MLLGKTAGMPCSSQKECQDDFRCLNQTCNCQMLEYLDEDKCFQRKDYRSPCNATVQCKDTLTCFDEKCQCDKSNYWKGTVCIQKKSVDTACILSTDCKSNLECSNGICVIQRRNDGTVKFYRALSEYTQGFGRADKEHCTFVLKLSSVQCIEGEPAEFKCRVSRKKPIAIWFKNNEEIKDNPTFKIENDDYSHKLMISKTCLYDAGEITVQVKNERSQAHLKVEIVDIFSSNLEPQTCFFGEDVKFECTLAVNESLSNWFKDINYYESHWQTTYTSQKHILMIKAVSFEDEGQYSINVRNVISSADLVVRDELLIKIEDIHYLLSVHAISNIATPAVRDVKRSPLNSAHFDLRLMVLLLRNIASFDIVNSLPEPTNTSKDADLSRIHYYRNLIAHNHGRMSNEDLVQSVKDLMETEPVTYGNGLTRDRIVNCVAILLNFLQVAKRLRSMPMNSSSVEKQLWIDHFDSPDKLTQAVKRVACPVVRLKFNTIFHSKELKQTLKDNTNKLIQLKVEKRITPSQWDLLFPTNVDKTSSKDFGLKLMLILISILKPADVTDEEMQAFKSLESYLYTVARSNSGRVSKGNFEDFCKDICSAIILIGGDSYEKRFTKICCSLHIDLKIETYLKLCVRSERLGILDF
ncbi:TTN [Mytilus edulis]|uniref:TTN n=1 Tax=Mytilus edulis TaxID=6550 RepID=A0A8S3SCW8_MYTED|nr:TTN [Mytilus edulis]